MKKVCFYAIFLTLFFQIQILFSKQVEEHQAKWIAKNHFAMHFDMNPEEVDVSLNNQYYFYSSTGNQYLAFFIFNINNDEGFEIIAADDLVYPILAYGNTGKIDQEDMPRGLRKLLDALKNEIKHITELDLPQTTEVEAKWLKYSTFKTLQSSSGVSPLTTTQWNQRPHYNLFCPDNAPSGCVATAVSQILKYHNHPSQGSGYHSYNHANYGALSANFGTTTYPWNNMPNKLLASSSTVQKEAISLLMYHVGVALDMNYGPDGSGTSSSLVPDALVDYFKYSDDMQLINRSDFSLSSWKSKLKAELNASRVIYHRGFCPDPQAGHAFVLDGYDNDNLFHVNWGWNGSQDGYFEINNLNPGSTYTFNQGQGAIIGIKPGDNSVQLKLFSDIQLTPSIIDYNQAFSIAVDIANYGGSTFSGKLMAAIMDQNNMVIDTVSILNVSNLNDFNYDDYTFSSTGLNLPPGDYKLGIFSANTGTNWVLIDQDVFLNPISLNISGSATGLFSGGNIIVDPNPIIQNQSFLVEANIKNFNSTAFSGSVSADIHESNGDWVATIEEINSVSINSGASKDFTFNSSGMDLLPGTYQVVLWYQASGGGWEVVSSGIYPSSLNVNVTGVDFVSNLPDPYESNNTMISAYDLHMQNWQGDSCTITTPGSNIHENGDIDYYRLKLPESHTFEIKVNIHDNYRALDGGDYSNDLLFTLHDGVSWNADYFDDVEMPSFIATENTITIKTHAYYAEDLGSYGLEIKVKRFNPNAVTQNNNEQMLVVYPNPAQDYLMIKNLPINQYYTARVYNVLGEYFDIQLNKNRMDLKDLNIGSYFIQIMDSNKNAIGENLRFIKK